MNQYIQHLTKNSAINYWRYTKLKKRPFESPATTFDAPVNTTEGYLEIEYPVRTEFLKEIKEIQHDTTLDFSQFYCGFENPRVDFSTFLTTPHVLSTFLNTTILSPEKRMAEFSLTTCGRSVIWLNGEKILDFHPYTRNHGTSCQVLLPLKAGANDLIIYMDDLAERDVNFFIELKLLSDLRLDSAVELDYEAAELENILRFMEGLYFKKDLFTSGDICLYSDSSIYTQLSIRYDDPLFDDLQDDAGGNITDFSRKPQIVYINDEKFTIASVETMNTAGMTKIYVGITLSNGKAIYKKFVFTSYDELKLDHSLGDSLNERKEKALEIFANLDLIDLNSALSQLHLNPEWNSEVARKLQPAYSMIENRGDCADFMFAPLLSFTQMYQEKLPIPFLTKIKQLAVHFRYWIDEPGNDVMWYFSENHSLLFHSCQYLAGHLYANEHFVTSNRKGEEQYLLGKERLLEWFNQFEAVGFSEWNSATYLPIDLIGFFCLYNAAPDDEIRRKAKKALDFTFKIMAINAHGGTLSSTFGRTYEHDLKAMKLGEISNLMAIAWDKGHFNYALRATTLFCLSDYEPPQELLDYLDLSENEYLTANYLQGLNRVETYLYKCSEYSMASAIQYNQFKKGHQQHMMNLSLGNDSTQLWINNPGEYMHSGENRPSFWAGNGSCPEIVQYKNTMFLEYRLANSELKFVHLYLPYWNLDQVISADQNWLFIKKNHTYLAVHFSEGYNIEQTGDTRGREVVSSGEKQKIIVKASSKKEVGSFENFQHELLNAHVSNQGFIDFQWGEMSMTNGLILNGSLVKRASSYEIMTHLEKESRKD